MYAYTIRKLEEKKEENHVTPKSFLKKCVGCGREIPIALQNNAVPRARTKVKTTLKHLTTFF
jgi:hypothetical protein